MRFVVLGMLVAAGHSRRDLIGRDRSFAHDHGLVTRAQHHRGCLLVRGLAAVEGQVGRVQDAGLDLFERAGRRVAVGVRTGGDDRPAR